MARLVYDRRLQRRSAAVAVAEVLHSSAASPLPPGHGRTREPGRWWWPRSRATCPSGLDFNGQRRAVLGSHHQWRQRDHPARRTVTQRLELFTPAALFDQVPLLTTLTITDRLASLPKMLIAMSAISAIAGVRFTRRRRSATVQRAPEPV